MRTYEEGDKHCNHWRHRLDDHFLCQTIEQCRPPRQHLHAHVLFSIEVLFHVPYIHQHAPTKKRSKNHECSGYHLARVIEETLPLWSGTFGNGEERRGAGKIWGVDTASMLHPVIEWAMNKDHNCTESGSY